MGNAGEEWDTTGQIYVMCCRSNSAEKNSVATIRAKKD